MPLTTRRQRSATAAVVLLLCIALPTAHGWKQLQPPTSFSISQQHPAASGVGQHHNTLGGGGGGGSGPGIGSDEHYGDVSGGAHSSSSITFGNSAGGAPTISTHVGHGGPTYSTSSVGSSVVPSLSSGSSSEEEGGFDSAEYDGQTEPRILHGHHGGIGASAEPDNGVFESNYYGDFGAPAVSGFLHRAA